ncbi:MAG: FG-GAP repeat domain-containing protein, partial [Planctomycetota bacterium JB042]
MMRSPALVLAVALAALPAVTACRDEGGRSSEERDVALASIEDPASRIADLEVVEDLSEAVAAVLIDWGEALRRGDLDRVRARLVDDFEGPDLAAVELAGETGGPVGIRRAAAAAEAFVAVGADRFVEGLGGFLSAFAEVRLAEAMLARAEFEAGAPVGVGDVVLTVLGRGADGGPLERVVRFRARFREGGGTWSIARVGAPSVEELRRSAPLFADVTVAAGVAHEGPAFGTEGNESFFWEGAASADVDGDGRFDVFVPSDGRNFLDRIAGEGTFEEI